MNKNFKTGEFVDFKSDSGKWFHSKVISSTNNKIELEYVIFNSPIGKCNHRKCWIDIKLRCINLKANKLVYKD